jgi:hypothetical protein
MSSYDIVIDSSTRKDRATTDANNFISYLSTPLYGIQSVNFVSASIPYISTASTDANVHAYYVVLEVPNYGILTDRIYTVDNPYAYKDAEFYTSVNIIAVASTTGLETGMSVSGSGIDSGTTVTEVGTGTVTLSKPQTGTVSGTGTFVETDLISSKSEDYFLTVSDTDELSVGMTASGTGIDASATISAFADATTVILSLPNTGTVSGTITFNGDIEKTGSGVATANNDQLYVSNVSELSAGMSVSGTGIPGGTTILSISDYIVTLSASKTSTINEELTFTRTVTTTISEYLSSTEILISPTSQNIELGMDVTGIGIGTNAKVTGIDGTIITLSVANSGVVSGLITFVNAATNRFNFAYTGTLITPQVTNPQSNNYVMSSLNDHISVEKTIPIMEAIKVSIYYYDVTTGSFKLYPFDNAGTDTEEFVLKLNVQATKDKRFATKQQDEDDKRIEPNIAPPVTPGSENTFARKLINYYRSATRNKNNPEVSTEPVGALLPRREFMGVPTKYAQILIPIAVVLLVLAILLAK